MSVNNALLMSYVNLPKSWAECTWEETKMVSVKVDKIMTSFSNLPPPPLTVFVNGNIGVLVNAMTEQYPIKLWRGVDFIEYFNNSITDKSLNKVPDSKFIVLYNVGLEQATSTTYSGKILRGFIKEAMQNNSYVFIQSDSPYGQISSAYDFITANRLRIPYPAETVLDL